MSYTLEPKHLIGVLGSNTVALLSCLTTQQKQLLAHLLDTEPIGMAKDWIEDHGYPRNVAGNLIAKRAAA